MFPKEENNAFYTMTIELTFYLFFVFASSTMLYLGFTNYMRLPLFNLRLKER